MLDDRFARDVRSGVEVPHLTDAVRADSGALVRPRTARDTFAHLASDALIGRVSGELAMTRGQDGSDPQPRGRELSLGEENAGRVPEEVESHEAGSASWGGSRKLDRRCETARTAQDWEQPVQAGANRCNAMQRAANRCEREAPLAAAGGARSGVSWLARRTGAQVQGPARDEKSAELRGSLVDLGDSNPRPLRAMQGVRSHDFRLFLAWKSTLKPLLIRPLTRAYAMHS